MPHLTDEERKQVIELKGVETAVSIALRFNITPTSVFAIWKRAGVHKAIPRERIKDAPDVIYSDEYLLAVKNKLSQIGEARNMMFDGETVALIISVPTMLNELMKYRKEYGPKTKPISLAQSQICQ